jgi:hypothetical protein
LRTWAFSLCLAALGPSGALAGQGVQLLQIQAFQLDCSKADPDSILEAVSGAAKLLLPCGILLRGEGPLQLASQPGWCSLPDQAALRRPLLRAMTRPERLKNLRGLSLFILPTGPKARYAFSVVDRTEGAGCGSPAEAQGLADSGSMFLTDFGLGSDAAFSSLLLAHEIVHELTMKRHPTLAPRGTILADHIADFGPLILPSDCACMRQSPFLKPCPEGGCRP